MFFKKTLPVLMYHQVISDGVPGALCITAQQLAQQLQYISSKGYTTITVQQLIDNYYAKTPLPAKALLLTFDDGYQNNFTNLYPLLVKYGLRATIFLNPFHVEEHSIDGNTFLSFEEIKQLDKRYIELALHTYHHKSYNDLAVKEILADTEKCIAWFNTAQIPFTPAHAYTYGAYPKKDAVKQTAIVDVFRRTGIKMAFRIGNRLNFLPVKDPYLIQRIDIKGTDPFSKFRRKLKYGAKYLLY